MVGTWRMRSLPGMATWCLRRKWILVHADGDLNRPAVRQEPCGGIIHTIHSSR